MSDNPELKELNISDPITDIGFDPKITDYSFSVPNEYTTIGMEIIPTGEYSTYVEKWQRLFTRYPSN